MSDINFNRMFITGGSTENPTVTIIGNEDKSVCYTAPEQFIMDMVGDCHD